MVSAIVVDDDRDTANTFVDYLQLLGVQVLGVGHNGKAAVSLYEEHRPDIAFLDLMMPEFDGFYALDGIRKIHSKAKIVVVTADLRNDTKERLARMNPTEIIYKPFDPAILKELVEKHGRA